MKTWCCFSCFGFHYQQLRGKDGETLGWRERGEGGRGGVCCLVVWSRGLVKELHLHASLPSSLLPPSAQSLLQPVCRKCPPSWHTQTHRSLKCWPPSPRPDNTKVLNQQNVSVNMLLKRSWMLHSVFECERQISLLLGELSFSRWCSCLFSNL